MSFKGLHTAEQRHRLGRGVQAGQRARDAEKRSVDARSLPRAAAPTRRR